MWLFKQICFLEKKKIFAEKRVKLKTTPTSQYVAELISHKQLRIAAIDITGQDMSSSFLSGSKYLKSKCIHIHAHYQLLTSFILIHVCGNSFSSCSSITLGLSNPVSAVSTSHLLLHVLLFS